MRTQKSSLQYKDVIKSLRRRYPDLPKRVSNDTIEALTNRIHPWIKRVQKNQKRYEKGNLNPPQNTQNPFLESVMRKRTTAYLKTPMKPEERKALHKLYAGLSPYIFSIISSLDDIPEDTVGQSFELFARVVSNWDPQGDTNLFNRLADKFKRDVKKYRGNYDGTTENRLEDVREPYTEAEDKGLKEVFTPSVIDELTDMNPKST